MAFDERAHAALRQPVALGKRRHPPAAIVGDAGEAAKDDPEIAIACGCHRVHERRGGGKRLISRPCDEPLAVKACETSGRSHPEIAVAVLRDGQDVARRKPIPGGPRGERILRRGRGFESGHRQTPYQADSEPRAARQRHRRQENTPRLPMCCYPFPGSECYAQRPDPMRTLAICTAILMAAAGIAAAASRTTWDGVFTD